MFENAKYFGDEQIISSIINLFERYFIVKRISLGALCRKAVWLLMDLATTTKSQWSLRITYDDKFHRYTALFLTQHKTGPCFIDITMSVLEKSSLVNSRNILNEMFTKDQWVPFPVNAAWVDILTNRGKFFLHKARYDNTWCVDVKPLPRSIVEWSRGFISRLFSSAHDKQKVITSTVSNTVDVSSAEHLKAWLNTINTTKDLPHESHN